MSLLGEFEIIQMGASYLLYCMYIPGGHFTDNFSCKLKIKRISAVLSVTDTGILINIGRIAGYASKIKATWYVNMVMIINIIITILFVFVSSIFKSICYHLFK